MSPNLRAFLAMLSFSEGTDRFGKQQGYDVLVGGKLFTGFADHPRQVVQLRSDLKSSAAGRYQILARYFDAYRKTLKLKDFSPAAQDAIAVQMIKEQGALADVEAGRLDAAISKCANIWASLPGAGYGQRENKLENLRAAFVKAGGTLNQ